MAIRSVRYRIATGPEWLMLGLLMMLLVSQFSPPERPQPPAPPVSAITLTTAKAKLHLTIGDRTLHIPMFGFVFVGHTGVENPTIAVCAGEPVTVTLINGDGFSHLLVLRDEQVTSAIVAERNDQAVFVFTPVTGAAYTYYCPIDLHSEFGMQGHIVVADC